MPKLRHFIWVGSIIPDKYVNNLSTYVNNNPDNINTVVNELLKSHLNCKKLETRHIYL